MYHAPSLLSGTLHLLSSVTSQHRLPGCAPASQTTHALQSRVASEEQPSHEQRDSHCLLHADVACPSLPGGTNAHSVSPAGPSAPTCAHPVSERALLHQAWP